MYRKRARNEDDANEEKRHALRSRKRRTSTTIPREISFLRVVMLIDASTRGSIVALDIVGSKEKEKERGKEKEGEKEIGMFDEGGNKNNVCRGSSGGTGSLNACQR